MADIFTALLGIFDSLVKGLESWKFLCYGLFLVAGLIMSGQIQIFRDILSTMYTNILPYLLILFWAFFAGIIVKIGSSLFGRRKMQTARQAVIENLLSLSESEVAVLKYVLRQKKGAVWLPVENIDVLSLYSRNCLEPIWNFSSVRGNLLGENASCFAYRVPDVVKKYYREHSEELNKSWEDIAEAEELSVFGNHM